MRSYKVSASLPENIDQFFKQLMQQAGQLLYAIDRQSRRHQSAQRHPASPDYLFQPDVG